MGTKFECVMWKVNRANSRANGAVLVAHPMSDTPAKAQPAQGETKQKNN
jgi:hypothetical protein